ETEYQRERPSVPPTVNLNLERQLLRMLRQIAESAGTSAEDLTDDDIRRFYPLDDIGVPRDIFQKNFSALFKQYQIRNYENDVDQFRSKKYGSLAFLTDEE